MTCRLILVLGHWVQGNVDRLPSIEGDGGEVLIEKGFEHDNLVTMFQKRCENRVFTWLIVE